MAEADQTTQPSAVGEGGVAPEPAPAQPAPDPQVATLQETVASLQASGKNLQALLSQRDQELATAKTGALSAEDVEHFKELKALEDESIAELEAEELAKELGENASPEDLDRIRQRERATYAADLATRDERITALQAQMSQTTLRGALLQASAGRCASPNELAFLLEQQGNIRVGESGEVVVIDPTTNTRAWSPNNPQGYMTVEEAVDQYVAANPHHAVRRPAGTGSPAAATAGSSLPESLGNGNGQQAHVVSKTGVEMLPRRETSSDIGAPALDILDVRSLASAPGTNANDQLISEGLTQQFGDDVMEQAMSGRTLNNPVIQDWQRTAGAMRASPAPVPAAVPAQPESSPLPSAIGQGIPGPVQAIRDAQAAKRG